MMANLASAAENNTDPFSPGNARKFWDSAGPDFQNRFLGLFGMFWFVIGAFITVCLGGSASSYAAHKSGQFADPEKKSGGAVSMIGIVFIVLGLFLCLVAVKPYFGF